MELDDAIYQQVTLLSEQGNGYMDNEDWDKAIEAFQEALDMLPVPKNQWEAALWLNASIGDVCFMKEDFAHAKDAFFEALNCPDGQSNPFVLIRMGETQYELNDFENAKEYLLRAYMLEGEEVFEDEDPKYLKFMKEHFNL
jgi:tetratricopeptide (TPR) repeat protein